METHQAPWSSSSSSSECDAPARDDDDAPAARALRLLLHHPAACQEGVVCRLLMASHATAAQARAALRGRVDVTVRLRGGLGEPAPDGRWLARNASLLRSLRVDVGREAERGLAAGLTAAAGEAAAAAAAAAVGGTSPPRARERESGVQEPATGTGALLPLVALASQNSDGGGALLLEALAPPRAALTALTVLTPADGWPASACGMAGHAAAQLMRRVAQLTQLRRLELMPGALMPGAWGDDDDGGGSRGSSGGVGGGGGGGKLSPWDAELLAAVAPLHRLTHLCSVGSVAALRGLPPRLRDLDWWVPDGDGNGDDDDGHGAGEQPPPPPPLGAALARLTALTRLRLGGSVSVSGADADELPAGVAELCLDDVVVPPHRSHEV